MYNDVYCGSARCSNIILDRYIHYNPGLRKAFHYETGCAFDAANDLLGNHRFELRERRDFIDEADDEELRFD